MAYVFEDPNCVYCARFDRDVAPLVSSGRLQLKIVLVAFLKPSSHGRAAAIWKSQSPVDAMLRNVDGFHSMREEGGLPPVVPNAKDLRALDEHMTLLQRLGAVSTPSVLYRRGDHWVVSRGIEPSSLGSMAAPRRIPQPPLPSLSMHFGGQQITAEIARTESQMETGLMGRESLAPDHGMLFVFPTVQRVCMWMKDTSIPLSVAFLDAKGRVINTAEMAPQTLNAHCSDEGARYALEMPSGWMPAHRIRHGDVVQGLP